MRKIKLWICYESGCEGTYTRQDLEVLLKQSTFVEKRLQGTDFDSRIYEMEHMQILIPL